LAYVTGLVNQELLLQNEYPAAENHIWKAHLQWGLRLSDGERATLAEIGRRLGRKGLQPVARIAKPDTILGWYRRLMAEKFDGSKRRHPGRPRVKVEVEALVVPSLARTRVGVMTASSERWPTWGTECLTRPWATSCAGTESNQFRSGAKQPPGRTLFAGTWTFSPAHGRSRRHMDVLAGTDFFTVELLTRRGLVTYYVLFFIDLESRRVSIAGITDHPEACWMRQMACNATWEGMGRRNGCRYWLHDRDAKFGAEFRETLAEQVP
jgi:hypothetical protein